MSKLKQILGWCLVLAPIILLFMFAAISADLPWYYSFIAVAGIAATLYIMITGFRLIGLWPE